MTNFSFLFRKKLHFLTNPLSYSHHKYPFWEMNFPNCLSKVRFSLLIYTKWILYPTWGEISNYIAKLPLDLHSSFIVLYQILWTLPFSKVNIKILSIRISWCEKLLCISENWFHYFRKFERGIKQKVWSE